MRLRQRGSRFRMEINPRTTTALQKEKRKNENVNRLICMLQQKRPGKEIKKKKRKGIFFSFSTHRESPVIYPGNRPVSSPHSPLRLARPLPIPSPTLSPSTLTLSPPTQLSSFCICIGILEHSAIPGPNTVLDLMAYGVASLPRAVGRLTCSSHAAIRPCSYLRTFPFQSSSLTFHSS